MFTFADAAVALVLIISAGMALLRGFVHEVLAIGSWLGAVVVTLYGFDTVEPWFARQIGTPWAANAATGAALFLTSLLLLSLVTKAISNLVRKSALNSVDSSLGFVFGLVRGAVLLSAAYYIAAQWVFEPGEMPDWLSSAKTRPWLERGAAEIDKLRPQSLMPRRQEHDTNAATGDLQEDSRLGELQAGFKDKATLEDLANPKPVQPAAAENESKPKGYDKDERREMDRLIKNNQ